jgi:hypothetical protein
MTGRFVSTATGFLVAFAVVGMAARPAGEPASLIAFNASVAQYVQLHRQIERQLPPLGAGSGAQDIAENANAMASALQTARSRAREGSIFTPAIGTLLRSRISDALAAGGFLPDEMIAATLEEADEQAAAPSVNGRFPWKRGAAMWPCVIAALPPLPEELQYRFVGRDLVLVDMHADLVVDILRNAVR